MELELPVKLTLKDFIYLKYKYLKRLFVIMKIFKDMSMKDTEKEKLRKIYFERKNMLTNQQFVL